MFAADVVTRGEKMRGVEAHTQSLRFPHIGHDESEMLEPITEARTLSGCGLEGDLRFHVRDLAKHFVDRSDNFLQTGFFACAKVGARMQHQKWQFKLVSTGEFLRKGADRIHMKLRIRRSQIDKII